MFFRAIAIAALIGWFTARPAAAQIPPVGYDLVRVTNTPSRDERSSQINVHGQIVWSDNTTAEIFLYDGRTGEVTQITNNLTADGEPSINADGVIAWTQVIGPATPDGRWAEIMLRTPDGTVTRLTDNQTQDSSPSINGLNQVAWNRMNPRGCDEIGRDVMFFDGQTIRQITDNDWDNQGVNLNDRGDIIWTEYDFCFPGFNWRSKIKLYRDGQILTLFDDDDLQAQATNINNTGLCAWSTTNRYTGERRIYLWEDGELTLLTEGSINPKLNDSGDVFFIRWHESNFTWQAWAYLSGRFQQLTDDPHWNADGDISNRGEMCWTGGPHGNRDVWHLKRLPFGDLNCDGIVDALDIERFLQALFDPKNFPPDCDPTLADINEDGAVNALDIEPFIGLLFP